MPVPRKKNCRWLQQVGSLVALYVVFSGCETVVNVNLPAHEPVLTANCVFNPDSVWQVQLSRSNPALDNMTFLPVINATVEIWENENVVARLLHTGNGTYRPLTNAKPAIGANYTLSASAPGYETIQATDAIPERVPFQSVELDSNFANIIARMKFSDPPDRKNYYLLQALAEYSDRFGGRVLIPIYFETDDLLAQDLGIEGSDAFIFDDAIISGKEHEIKIRLSRYYNTRKMYIVLVSLSEAYYTYLRSSESQGQANDNPFSIPVQVYNNIENGLGIFAGFSSSTFSTESGLISSAVPGQPR